MELKHVKTSYLLISVLLIQGVIVSCQVNATESTNNTGGELSVQLLLETTSTSTTTTTTTTTTKITEENTSTTPPPAVEVAFEITATSHPVVTSFPVIALMTSSIPIKVVDVVSEDVKQVMTPEVQAPEMTTTTPMLTSHPVFSSSPVMTSSKSKMQMSVTEELELAKTPQVESSPSRSAARSLMMSNLVAKSSSVIELMTSSQSLPEIEAVPLSSTSKPSSSVVTSSQIMKPLKSSTPAATVDVVTKRGMTSSSSVNEMSSSEALKIVPSTILEKQETSSSSATVTEILRQTMPSSSSKEILFSQSTGEMTSSRASKIVTSSQVVRKTSFPAEEEITTSKALETAMLPTMVLSSSDKEKMTSSQALEIVTSSQNEEAVAKSTHEDMRPSTTIIASVPMTSSSKLVEVLTSQTVDVLMSAGTTDDITTPQPTKTMISFSTSSTSSSYVIKAVTSSQVKTETGFSSLHTLTVSTSFWASDVTSRQPPKTSPAITDISSSYKEMKAFKTTLTFSSSQLADVKATTTEKTVGSSPTQLPTDVMTSSSSSASVAITTSSKNDSAEHSAKPTGTEHHPTDPTHHTEHEDTHHTHPNESHSHTTHKSHEKHVTYHTMDYPHEPDVDAATGAKNKNDKNYVVSILVVFALLGGMVLFVVVMVIKDRARTGGANLSAKKRPAVGGDNGFVPLEELKVEKEPKITHVEKRNSQRYSYHGNPEDAVPLLELHIKDGEHPVLNAHDESQDTQPEETAASEKKGKPLLDVYGDGSTSMSPGKSKEKVSEHGFI